MAHRKSWKREKPSVETVSGTVVAALIAGLALAGLLDGTGGLEDLRALYGLEVDAWRLAVVHGVAGAVPFVAGLTRVARHRYAPAPLAAALRSPFLGGCLGAAYGAGCWLVLVAYVVPIVIGFTGGQLPVPYQHPESLIPLIGYGAVLGSWYPLVRTAVTDHGPTRRTRV